MQTFNPWAIRKEEFEADGRDYVVEAIFELPEKFTNLPASINLLARVKETYNQNCIPSCTAMWLSHTVLMQNIIDFNTSSLFVDWKDQRTNQWKKLSCNNESWDYLEHALSVLYKTWVKGTNDSGKPYTFNIDGYAYQRFQANKYGIDTIKYLLVQGKPLYTSFKWNRVTWNEMNIGELKTIINPAQADGGHCVTLCGVDDKFVYFANSWNPNKGTLSTFQIAHDNFFKCIEMGMINRRYRVVFDKKDIKGDELFTDFYREPASEEYKAVKYCKDTGLIKGSNGKLMPNEPVTRLQLALILYRMSLDSKSKTNDSSNVSKK